MTKDSPVRTCAACRTRRPQGALVRVARGEQRTLQVDQGTARAAGRGAYLCPDEQCIALARRRQVLRRALHCEAPAVIYDEIVREVARRRALGTGERNVRS